MTTKKIRAVFAPVIAGLFLCGALRAEDALSIPARFYGPETKPVGYDFDVDSGLYATVTAMRRVPQVDSKIEEHTKLHVPGFKKELEVVRAMQPQPAPLVVLLAGWASRSKSPMTRFLLSRFYAEGCSVMTFESNFTEQVNARALSGVSGNLEEEARMAGRIIAAFIQSSGRERITDVRIVGSSYGALIALHLDLQAQKGETSFQPSRILAVSPPVNLRTTAELLDRYHAEDRWNFTLTKLAGDLLNRKPVAPGEPVPFPDDEMRAGIAAAFYLDLADAVEFNDRLYDLNLLPKADVHDNQYRLDSAAAWTFQTFIDKMVLPYWHARGAVADVNELYAMGDVGALLPRCSNRVRVILTADDPLNAPEAAAQAVGQSQGGAITLLPRGGHLGFLGTEWWQAVCREFAR